MINRDKTPLLLFDGHCNLCNRAVQWVLKRDKKGVCYFASLQSETGKAMLHQYQLVQEDLDSMVLIKNGKAYTQSTAALHTAITVGGVYRLVAIFLLVPPPLRNAIYAFVARNRYRWFGRTEACWLPQPEWSGRFLN